MATGGEVAGATVHQSDAVHEYTCYMCSQDHVTTPATHYCPECDVTYCKACLCDHVVLGRSKIAEWGKTTPGRAGNQSGAEVEETTCVRHTGYTVTLYCVIHDVVCCQLCSSTDHRSCKNMEKIPAIAQTHNIDDTVEHVEAAIARSVSNVDTLGEDSEVRKKFLHNSYANYDKQLNELQEMVLAKFDEVRKEMLLHKQHYIDKFKMDQLMCKKFTQDLEKMTETLVPIEDKQTRFIRVKRAQELMLDKDKEIEAIFSATVTGMFVNIPRTEEAKVLDAVAVGIGVTLTEMKFSIETREDELQCYIVGMCQIADGNLVLADRSNKCLKRMDSDYTVIGRYKLQGNPNAICATGDSEIAIVMDDKQIIEFAVGVCLEKIHSFNVEFSCSQIAAHNKRMYLTESINLSYKQSCYCAPKTHIYDPSGKAITCFTVDVGYHDCRSYGYKQSVAVSDDGEKVFMTHPFSGYLVAFDSEGRKIAQTFGFTHVNGLCVDNHGYLYASKYGSSEVVTISQESFKQVKTVTFSFDGTATSGSSYISYDRKLNRVIICPENSKYIFLEKRIYVQ